jgi:hypothetical protein
LLEVPQRLPEETAEKIERLDADVELPAIEFLSKDPLTHITEQYIDATAERAGQLDWDVVEALVERSDGIPDVVGISIKNAATSAAF